MFENEDDVFTNSPKLNFDDNNNNTNGSFKFNEEDSMLALATEECMKTGTFLPLLKEELKCKILAKCHEEGKQLNIKAEQRVAAPKKKVNFDIFPKKIKLYRIFLNIAINLKFIYVVLS